MAKTNQEEIIENHFELCEELHNNMNEIPKSVRDKIWDLVYAHYDPPVLQ